MAEIENPNLLPDPGEAEENGHENGSVSDDKILENEASEEPASGKSAAKPQTTKKKRTKKVTKRKKTEENGDTSEDNEDETNAGGAKKKRKKKSSKKSFQRRNIKDVYSEDKLEESTKNALAEEQQRLQRLQQAQRDAFANEVLRDFDLSQLHAGIKNEDLGDPGAEEENEDKKKLDVKLQNLPPGLTIIKKSQELIDLSSDEEKPKPQLENGSAIVAEGQILQPSKAESDSDEIQILSDPDEGQDEDDPDNSGMHTNDRLNVANAEGKVVINISEKNPEQVITVASSIETIIKPHQIGGVRFLYDNIIESPSVYENSQGFGCILAHAMGLGKTLQIVTFSDVFLKSTSGRHILIIVPINTLQNWANEFRHWLPDEPFKVHLLSDSLKTVTARANVINSWKNDGGVLLMGYELFRLLAGTKAQQRKKKINKKKPLCIDIEEEDKEKDILVDVRKILVDPGPDLVICDEGHRIKNAHASISQVLKAIRTRRRVVLTGYPLQNNLMEYWCMVDFVRPNYLGTRTEFSNMFERPIQNGQCVDSTPRDMRLMMHRAHVLHTQLKGFVQRRSHRVLRKNLPPKYEHVLLVKMTPFQRSLYATFTEDLLAQKSMANPLKAFAVCCKIWNHPDVLCNFLRQKEALDEMDLDLEDLQGTTKKGKKKPGNAKKKPKQKQQGNQAQTTHQSFDGVPSEIMNGGGAGLSQHIVVPPNYDQNPSQQPNQYMQHPDQQMYQQYQQPYYQQQQDQFSSQFTPQHHHHNQYFPYPNNHPMQGYNEQYQYQQQQQQGYPPQQPLQMLQQQVEQQPQAQENGTSPSLMRQGPGFDPFVKEADPAKKDEINYDWANGMFNDYVTGLLENSNKFLVFFKLLEETIKCGERMLLFSQSLLTLDLIEDFLQSRNVPTTDEKWSNGTSYFRLDGSTPSSERDRLIHAFNGAEALKIPLFLVSTRAGSLGINLVGANRVVIFDASWNPCHDSQAVCRVYRYGQIKSCYIYRLVSDQCLEKKIYDRQINKQGMSDRVVDEANPDNYLSTKDIHSLWGEVDLLKEIPDKIWDVSGCVEKCQNLGDIVLANVLLDCGQQSLSQYPFTHESLLVDRKEKKLSRIEKRIAERSFEAERHAQISYTRPSYAAYYPKGKDPALNQNYIGCRKESWKPPPMVPEEDLVHIRPPSAKAHPNYNGMGMPGNSRYGPSATSQPIQAHPPAAGGPPRGFPIEALARREGVKLQEVYVPRDIVIPTKNQTPIALKAGQRVMLIKTPKGIYLRLKDQIVKIRVPNGLLPFGPVPPNEAGPGDSGPSGIQQQETLKRPSPMTTPTSKPDVVTLHSSGEDE